MNSANFANLGTGAMLNGVNPQGALQSSQNAHIHRHILQELQKQGPFSGWRAEFPISERINWVSNMTTSLRLIQPRLEILNAVNGALTIEEKAFREASQREEYEKECANKLHTIKETRQRQQNVYNQSGLMQHGNANGGMPVHPNQLPPQFTPQMNRAMQTSPTPGQMSMHMNINDPNMMQQQQHSQAPQQQQVFMQNQMGQQRMATGVPLVDELSLLSQSEFEHISRVTASVMAKTPPEELEKRRAMTVAKLTPEQKQLITQKYGDPLTWMTRLQILRSFKKRNQQLARAQGLDPNSNPGMGGGDGMMNAAQRQIPQNMIDMQRNAALSMNPQTGLDPSAFLGNIENIQGQQADGLRSQEAGQLVVPASTASMAAQNSFIDPSGLFQSSAPQQNAQANLNRPINSQQFLAQQQLQNAQSIQQLGLQQSAKFQAQNQAQAQAQAQVRAHNAKMAQAGAQNAGQLNQGMPHQSPAMPMLNRPVGPNMSPAQAAAGHVRPPSRQPGMNGAQPGNQQAARPQIPQNIPAAVRDQLAQMTPEQFHSFMMSQQRRVLQNSQAARTGANGQPMPMQTSMSQYPQNGQFNGSNLGASLPMQQSLNGLAGGVQNNALLLQGQQLSLQQQQQHQQQQALIRHQQALMRSQSSSQSQKIEMNADQIREMDRMAFPPSMINNQANMSVPKTVKTWGQLKTWVGQNPQILGSVDLSQLLDLQRLHFEYTVTQQREAGKNMEQTGQSIWPGTTQQFMPGQNANARPQATLPPAPTVTPEEIFNARKKFPHLQNMSDDSLKTLLLKHKHKAWMTQLQARGISMQQLNQAQSQIQNASQSQPSQVSPMAASTSTKPAGSQKAQVSQSAPAPQTSNANAANVKSQPTAPGGKTAKSGGAGKSNPKKRPHTEDVIELQNQKVQQPPQAPTATAATARLPLNLTKEQIAALPPQQRAQFDAQMKRQARLPVPRPLADENWNNALPDQLKPWYNQTAKTAASSQGHADIPAEEKALMSKNLRDSTDMLSRLDNLLRWLINLGRQEKNIRSLLSMRIHLIQQFKPTDWTVNDDITIAPDNLKKSLALLKNMFTSMIVRVQSQQLQQVHASMPSTSGPPPLNASNLQQLEEEAKRARRTQSQNVPAAPTSTQPPFPLGEASPQGVPQVYGPGGFSPDKLKIPPTKRRKQSHASAPTITSGAAAKAAPKVDPAKTSLLPCPHSECGHHAKGFSTQAALEKHLDDEHKAKEEIPDPLKYALESFNAGLGLPESDQAVLDDGKDEKLKPSDALFTKQDIKSDSSTAPGIGATPMSRMGTQTDVKTMSPASTSMTTPRLPAAKATKPAASKQAKTSVKSETVKGVAESAAVTENAIIKDEWADSKISLDAIQEAFDIPITDTYPGMGGEFFDLFLNSDMFTTQNEDTPDSIDSTTFVTQTPNDGDVVNQDSAIHIQDVEENGSWPADWFSHPGPILSGIANDDPWMNWETVNKELEAAPLPRNVSFSVP